MVSAITTHVLDAALGRPAAGVPVRLEHLGTPGNEPTVIGTGQTNADGRIPELGPESVAAGVYRLTFDTATYFAASGQQGFYPTVTITFEIVDSASHYHVPVLLSPFAYSTYRGS